MYWLAGIEANRHGTLFSFEPNEEWAVVARRNLAAIGARFDLAVGTFEELVDRQLGDRPIDIALIDAIHESTIVHRQYAMVLERLAPRGLVLLDDVDFSPDMASCWDAISRDARVAASLVLQHRLGIVELA